jgi:hypothetical protein
MDDQAEMMAAFDRQLADEGYRPEPPTVVVTSVCRKGDHKSDIELIGCGAQALGCAPGRGASPTNREVERRSRHEQATTRGNASPLEEMLPLYMRRRAPPSPAEELARLVCNDCGVNIVEIGEFYMCDSDIWERDLRLG